MLPLMKTINLKYLTLLFLFIITVSTAQYSEEFHKYNAEFPDEQMIRLKSEKIISIKIVDGKINIQQENFEEDIYMNESASYGSKGSVSSSSFFELENLEASSFQYENGKYRESKVENFSNKDEINESFYDDVKTHNFIYPKLKKGSKTSLKYTENIKDPRFLSSFYFGSFFPIVNNKVVIIADKEISLRFKEFNTENVDIAFSEREKKGQIIYTWELNNTEKYEYEESVPSYKNILPHIIPIINSYSVDGETVKVLEDVSDLYDWYYSLVKNINSEEIDKNLVKLVEEITAGKENDLEKVRAIYYWVQSNIKYIAYEYSLGGFIPRDANVVYKKKYGDCKDNSSILKEMLDIAGLKGNLTWVGTRTIPYTYNEVPTPVVDNHMILSYKYQDKIYFLDATGRFTPLDFPSSFIQGKEALVEDGKGKFEIVKIPVISADKNEYKDVSNIKILDDKVTGTAQATLTGYKKVNYFNNLENENTDTKIKEFYNARFRKGNNKFLIEEIKETNKFDYDKDLIVDYSFNIDNYVKKIGDEIYINLNLNKPLTYFKTEKDREYEIGYTYKQKFQYITQLDVPEGYEVDYLPENFSIANDFVTCTINYEQQENQIIYTQTVILDFLSLDIAQQKEVNQLIKKTDKAYKEIIVLKKSEE